MKHKNKNFSKGSTVAALDIGSSKVACLIAHVTDDQGTMEIAGVGHQASAGIKNGTITDLKAIENVIRHTVHTAENMAAKTLKGYPLRDVIVNMPAVHTQQQIEEIDINISGHDVTDMDVYRALSRAQQKAAVKHPDSVQIHSVAASCTIDDHSGIQEPIGMVGENLHLDVNVISAETAAVKNITTSIERSHLDIIGFCHSAYAAGLSSLVEDEMELGSTIIDMGGGTTSIAVFAGKKLIFIDALPVGGNHVTADIARGLTTSINHAERLKTLYGSAMGTLSDESEMIDVPQIGEDQMMTHQNVPRSLLVGIIQPRLEEIFELVRAKLNDSGLGSLAGRRIVLTGGASQIPGLRDISQHILDKQVRLGRPVHTNGLPDTMQGPGFATTTGLLIYLAERAHEVPENINASSDDMTIYEKFKLWFRENW